MDLRCQVRDVCRDRRRSCSKGNGVFENAGVLARLRPLRGNDVNIAAEKLLKFCDEIGQIEIGSPRGEISKKVAITQLGVAATSSGTDKVFEVEPD